MFRCACLKQSKVCRKLVLPGEKRGCPLSKQHDDFGVAAPGSICLEFFQMYLYSSKPSWCCNNHRVGYHKERACFFEHTQGHWDFAFSHNDGPSFLGPIHVADEKECYTVFDWLPSREFSPFGNHAFSRQSFVSVRSLICVEDVLFVIATQGISFDEVSIHNTTDL